MNNKTIDATVYEQYEEASVALFMECYSATLLEDIRTDLGETEQAGLAFPDALDARCRALLRKAERRRKRKTFLGATKKVLHIAAIFVVAMLCLASLLFTTVEAFRETVIKFYIEQSGDLWEIGSITNNGKKTESNGVSHTDPLAGLLPEGYELIYSKGTSFKKFATVYKKSAGEEIHFSGAPGTTFATIDAEDAQVSREFILDDYRGIYVEKGVLTQVAWVDESRETIFMLTATSLSEHEILGIAEKFVEKF